MPVIAISREEFDAFDPVKHPMVALVADERSWFTDTAQNLIGTAIFDKTDKDCGWILMGRDPHGRFRAIKTHMSLASKSAAEGGLRAAILEVEASGETVFEQAGLICRGGRTAAQIRSRRTLASQQWHAR